MTFSPAFRADAAAEMAPRIETAYTDFAATLARLAPAVASDARQLARFYVSAKLAKLDPIIGRVTVKHGGYLDAPAIWIARAIMQAKAGRAAVWVNVSTVSRLGGLVETDPPAGMITDWCMVSPSGDVSRCL